MLLGAGREGKERARWGLHYPPLQEPDKMDHNRSNQQSGPEQYPAHGDKEYDGRGTINTEHLPQRYSEDFKNRSRRSIKDSGSPYLK